MYNIRNQFSRLFVSERKQIALFRHKKLFEISRAILRDKSLRNEVYMKIKKYLFGMLGVCLLLAIDQFTKYLAVVGLMEKEGITLIPGVFELQYLENRGAAFGMLQNQRWPLLIVTFIALIALGFVYGKLPDTKRFRLLRWVVVTITAGAIGNMIDRLVHGYVIDFLYFSLIDFPIFNVADCYVCVAAFFAFVLICFYYKDEDFEFIKRKKAEDENARG